MDFLKRSVETWEKERKKTSVIEEVQYNALGITDSIKRWKYLLNEGGNDPVWPDGVNMNLVRNHILSYKRKIRELCHANSITIPNEYYLPTPPYIDGNYFANPKSDRAKRIMQRPGWRCCNHEKPIRQYDELQMALL